MAVIVIELFLVLGAVLAFAIWQFRDLAQERRKRQAREARQAHDTAHSPAEPAAEPLAPRDPHAR